MTDAEKTVNAAMLYQLRLLGNGVPSCASYFGISDHTVYRWLNSTEYFEIVDAQEKAIEAENIALQQHINAELQALLDEGKGRPLEERLRIMTVISRFVG